MPSGKKSPKKGTIRRRQLLKMLGLGGLALSGENVLSQIKIAKVIAPNTNDELKGILGADLVIHLLRPQDLLSLELHFFNFSLSGNQLIKKGDPALMLVKFPSQSIAESCGTETVVNNNDTLTLPEMPAKMVISNNSRLVFRIYKNLSLDVNELLAWENFEPVVNERAKPVAGGFKIISPDLNKRLDKIFNGSAISPVQLNGIKGISKDEKVIIKQRFFTKDNNAKTNFLTVLNSGITQLMNEPVAPPGDWETSLEIPLRLFLSPTKNAGWLHEIKLNRHKGILQEANQLFELWHTRMGTKANKKIDVSDLGFEERVLRVLWGANINKEYNNLPAATTDKFTDPFLGNTSMNDFYRHLIVHESSNFQIPGFMPQPVRAYKLFLTTLGAYLDSIFLVDRKKLESISSGSASEPSSGGKLALLKWRHIQTLAREHYVELVLAGNIMPFGHEAVLITITERKSHKSSGTATNFKRQLVVITEPSKDYNYRDSNNKFMNFCFHTVEMLTTASPLLDSPKKKLVNPSPMSAEEQFIIRSDNADVMFKIRGEDLNGNMVNFSMPLVFVSSTVLGNPANINALADIYNKGVFANNNADFKGQKISLAPLDPGKKGADTAFAGYGVNFLIQPYSSSDELQGFLPALGEVKIIEPSYQRLTGITQATPVSLVSDDNMGHVFAKFENSTPVNFAGNSDKTGGFALPNFNVSGLSKAAGAFGGDIEKFKNGAVAATDYFNVNNMPDPVLFGVFKLSDILNFGSGDMSGYDLSKSLIDRVSSKIPNLTTEETADAVKTSYIMRPQLTKWPADGTPVAKFVQFIPLSGSGFSIVTQAVSKKDPTGKPGIPSFFVDAKMGAFDISLMEGLIKVNFQALQFSASPAKSADINISMGDPALNFGGPLGFINAFQKLIPPGGFADPPYLDVSLTGIVCGYTLALPNLQLGAFTLSHLSLGAEVNLPFTGAPMTLGFRFCEKHQPFTLTVSLLGGGGYFGFEADLHGLRQIDAALEFGAAVSLNLGVASGAASVMAGIYFKMVFADGQNSAQLTGYLRINGALSILGLITASIELYMALTYLVDKHKAYGEASISIKVEVLFFSKTVEVHTSRTFAGSGSDPNFQLSYSQSEWSAYCNAFAA